MFTFRRDVEGTLHRFLEMWVGGRQRKAVLAYQVAQRQERRVYEPISAMNQNTPRGVRRWA